ncbi:MAG: ABC transporter permease [Candidatus Bipolaricaulia bacterium]
MTWLKGFLVGQWDIFRRDKLALFGLFVVFSYAIVAIFAPQIAPYGVDEFIRGEDGKVQFMKPPSSKFWFGTTRLGRDVFTQVVYGTRISLIIGLLSGLAVAFLGTILGIVAGYYKGRWIEEVLMRMVDIAYTIPVAPFVIIIVSLLSRSYWIIIASITILMWRSSARVVRAQTLSIISESYLEAARAIGASDLRIIFVHIFPNVLPITAVYVALGAGWAIITEANVSFLGYGSDAPSWGSLLQLAYATGAFRRAWWWALFPGLVLILLVVSIFFISRAYERVANPQLRE